MANVNLLLVIALVVVVWGTVFSVLHWRLVLRAAASARARYNNGGERRRTILHRANTPDGDDGNAMSEVEARPSIEASRARAYLQRILSLIGGTQTDGGYMMDVGKTRFYVKDRYVRRLRDSADPKCRCDVTCFYSIHEGMPREEEIASVLLQLKNNPSLFDSWAKQNGLPFKADGREFISAE